MLVVPIHGQSSWASADLRRLEAVEEIEETSWVVEFWRNAPSIHLQHFTTGCLCNFFVVFSAEIWLWLLEPCWGLDFVPPDGFIADPRCPTDCRGWKRVFIRNILSHQTKGPWHAHMISHVHILTTKSPAIKLALFSHVFLKPNEPKVNKTVWNSLKVQKSAAFVAGHRWTEIALSAVALVPTALGRGYCGVGTRCRWLLAEGQASNVKWTCAASNTEKQRKKNETFCKRLYTLWYGVVLACPTFGEISIRLSAQPLLENHLACFPYLWRFTGTFWW